MSFPDFLFTRTFSPESVNRYPTRVGFPDSGSTSITLETCIGASNVYKPSWFCWVGRACRVLTFTPPTTTRFSFGMTLSTSPRLPLSLPEITTTVSPRFILRPILEHLRGQRDYPRVALVPEFTGYRPEDARPARGAIIVDDDARVLTEADVRPIVPPRLLLAPHHDGPDDVALTHGATRRRLLDGGDDHVADSGTPPLTTTEDPDTEQASRTRVVGHPEPCLALDPYSALDMMFASRHRLRAERGRVSTILTMSPTRAVFCSSCTMKRLERLTRFLYIGCCTSVSTETATVLSGLSETTIPTRSLRLPRPTCAFCTGSAFCTGPGSWSSTGPFLAAPGPSSPVPVASASSCFSFSSVIMRSPAVSDSGWSEAGLCSSGPP